MKNTINKSLLSMLNIFFLQILLSVSAHAGIIVANPGDAKYNSPVIQPSLRTIDFSNVTLDQEKLAGRVASSNVGLVSYDAQAPIDDFSGNSLDADSAAEGGSIAQFKLDFKGGGTNYVSFLWGINVIDENSLRIIFDLSNGTSVSLRNCRTSSSNLCLANYVSTGVIDDLINFFYEMANVVRYKPIYVEYTPPANLKVISVRFQTYSIEAGSDSFWQYSAEVQNFYLDNISYVDATAMPHHMEITTEKKTIVAGKPFDFIIKSCFDASCSSYTMGVNGNISASGVGVSIAFSNDNNFSIPLGVNSIIVPAIANGNGVVNVVLSNLNPAVTPIYCGFGKEAELINSCELNIIEAVDHIELTATNNETMTCAPIEYKIKACSNGNCSQENTSGISGEINVSGDDVSYPSGKYFEIPAGQSSTTILVHAKTVGSVTASLSNLSYETISGVYCGMGQNASASGSCTIQMNDSGFLIQAPNHIANEEKTINISAITSSNSSTVCAPAFTSVKKTLNFKCHYSNPVNGVLPVAIGGKNLNSTNSDNAACDATGQSVELDFDAQGNASTTLKYADVGKINVSARYTDAEMNIYGENSFIAAPALFSVSSNTNGNIKAGNDFSITVVAKNITGDIVNNFGKETNPQGVKLSWNKYQPTGLGASNGLLSGNGVTSVATGFNNGALTINNLNWSEVGTGDIVVNVGNNGGYLDSGIQSTGKTGETGVLGPFIPDHFEVSISQEGCGAFTYSGQPFGVIIRAKNKMKDIVVNYDGSHATYPNFAKNVNLKTDSSLGAVSGYVDKNYFIRGEGSISNIDDLAPIFSFHNKLTSPSIIKIDALNNDMVASKSDIGANDSINVRSGRLMVHDNYGKKEESIKVRIKAEYWTDNLWMINGLDSCTTINPNSIVLASFVDMKGTQTSDFGIDITGGTIVNGMGELIFTQTNNENSGTVYFAINLGKSFTDNSCLNNHPNTSGANKSWLRSSYGSECLNDGDPSAKVTFGLMQSESNKIVYTREVF